ncbi:MAG: hypothetical protein M1510_09425 [Nitrospirae bacterium]|nr:hypothetical protein [Nitrospirota bacterium]MCL5237645.1 hypothetical protein [Nitrospirota bacterium]
MDELEKLKKLLHHWLEHNDGHAETYREWSEKALAHGNRELSEVLGRLYNETKKMRGLFEEAIKKAG